MAHRHPSGARRNKTHFSVSSLKVRASDKRALHLRYLLEDFFEDIEVIEEGEADFVLAGDLFEDRRFDPVVQVEVRDDNYLVLLHQYFSKERRDLGGWGILHGVRPLKWIHMRREQGQSQEQIRRDLKENGRLRGDKLDLLFEVEEEQKDLFHQDRDKLSLYISLPFCPTICHFCCFHSVPYTRRLSERYLEQLQLDLHACAQAVRQSGRKVDIVYLGGGTPTSLKTEQLERLLRTIEELFPKDTLKEYTIEAGRIDSFTEEKAALLARYASRVCINPQTFTEEVLLAVGRPSAIGTQKWIRYFRERGLLINADLIAGLPGESEELFSRSLQKLVSMRPDNITVHQLSKKKGSRMGVETKDNPIASDMTKQAYDLLKEAGYKPYYLYRQKKMVGRGENLGYALEGTQCIYNVRMMEDMHEILACGSNSVFKMIRGGALYRLQNLRDVRVFLSDPARYRAHLKTFFATDDVPDEVEID